MTELIKLLLEQVREKRNPELEAFCKKFNIGLRVEKVNSRAENIKVINESELMQSY